MRSIYRLLTQAERQRLFPRNTNYAQQNRERGDTKNVNFTNAVIHFTWPRLNMYLKSNLFLDLRNQRYGSISVCYELEWYYSTFETLIFQHVAPFR